MIRRGQSLFFFYFFLQIHTSFQNKLWYLLFIISRYYILDRRLTACNGPEYKLLVWTYSTVKCKWIEIVKFSIFIDCFSSCDRVFWFWCWNSNVFGIQIIFIFIHENDWCENCGLWVSAFSFSSVHRTRNMSLFASIYFPRCNTVFVENKTIFLSF